MRAANVMLVTLSLACSNGGTPDAGPPNLGFTPSNVVLGSLDFTGVGDVIISANHTIQTDDGGMLPSDNAGAYQYTELTQQSGPKLGVFTVKSLTIMAGATAVAQGADALVIVAIDQITVQGNLYGNSQFQNGGRIGPGAVDLAKPNSNGVGLGGGGGATGDRSAGGGGFCGKGGGGATLLTGPALGGVSYGTAALSPLLVGSSGGDGALAGAESASGGAIQLVAGNSITVSGVIHVGGKGGGAGAMYQPGSSQEAAGGGSGGAILLESQVVTVTGTLAANGAGGGQGNTGARGADATPDLNVAMGGNDGMSGSVGGNGSAGNVINATAGLVAPATTAGGGGGGAGWIRINTLSGMAMLMGGMLSPSVTTPCATQGQVAP